MYFIVTTDPVGQQQSIKSNGGNKKQNKKKVKNNQNDANKPDENLADVNSQANDMPPQEVVSNSEVTTSDHAPLNTSSTSVRF